MMARSSPTGIDLLGSEIKKIAAWAFRPEPFLNAGKIREKSKNPLLFRGKWGTMIAERKRRIFA
jgi:hypothetical protein